MKICNLYFAKQDIHLTVNKIRFYNTTQEKSDDEDSRYFPNVAESRRGCDSGTSRELLNITSELQR